MADPDTSDVVPYQISFVLDPDGDGRLMQFDFLARPSEVAAYVSALGDERALDLQDFQIYPPIRDADGMTATTTLEDIVAACSADSLKDPALATVRRIAAEIDEAAALSGAEKVCRAIEFVWDNGGGEDNAFAQSYEAAKGRSDLDDAFESALAVLLDYIAYDLSVVAEESVALMESLAEGVEAAAESVHDGAAALLRGALVAPPASAPNP